MSVDINFISKFITEDPEIFNETLPIGGKSFAGKPIGQTARKPKARKKLSQRQDMVMDPETGDMTTPEPTSTNPLLDKTLSNPIVQQLLKGSPQFNKFFHQILDKVKAGSYDDRKAAQMMQKAVEVSLDAA